MHLSKFYFLVQVQFRIQQIVSAPVKEKEHLLRDLEEFTFRGIPSAVSTVNIGTMNLSCHPDDIKGKIELQKEQQKDLIGQLKTQLEELESYAYETGDAGLPQSVLLEHHKIVVGENNCVFFIDWNCSCIKSVTFPRLMSRSTPRKIKLQRRRVRTRQWGRLKITR